MTKKFERLIRGPVFTEDGEIVGGNIRLMFNNGAAFNITSTMRGLAAVKLEVPNLWFSKNTLEQLIAELLFLKEEWDNHPIVLEQEQARDLEDNPFDEDEEGLELDEDGELEELEVPQPLRYHRVHP